MGDTVIFLQRLRHQDKPDMIKQYLYSTIAVLILVLSLTIVIQKGCYKSRESVITLTEKHEKIISELKEKPELASIVISTKPKGITVITKDTPKDTTVTIKEYDIPAESDFKICIDTTGQAEIIYRKWGGCARPMLTTNINLFGLNAGIGLRWLYWQKWGLYSGISVYPYFGFESGISYKLSKYHLTNCDLHGGVIWDGREITGTIGLGIYLW